MTTPADGGGGWKLVPPTDSSSVRDGQLVSVSCAGSKFCLAVGGHSASGHIRTLAEVWNGAAWRLVPSENSVPPGNYLASVSCASASFCMAVGSHGAERGRPLAEIWNGTALTVIGSPDLGRLTSGFAAVSCVTSALCVAVGDDDEFGLINTHAISAIWNGTTWSTMLLPAPLGPFDQLHGLTLTGVSCVSARFCMAVGNYWSTTTESVADLWNGATWRQVSAPAGQAPSGRLFRVSCSDPGFCMAVGVSNGQKTLAEEWTGGHWARARTPSPEPDDSLDDVSCVSATFCMAIGGSSYHNPLGERWNGMTWTLVSQPTSGNTASYSGKTDSYNGVACPAVSLCVAVGSGDRSSVEQTLIANWGGPAS
jgi:hypothetical protein